MRESKIVEMKRYRRVRFRNYQFVKNVELLDMVAQNNLDLFRGVSLQCICKVNRHRHFLVRVCPPIPQTCLKTCKIGNLALILRIHATKIGVFRNPRAWVNTLAGFKLRKLGPKVCRQMPTRCRQIRVLDSAKCIITNQIAESKYKANYHKQVTINVSLSVKLSASLPFIFIKFLKSVFPERRSGCFCNISECEVPFFGTCKHSNLIF